MLLSATTNILISGGTVIIKPLDLADCAVPGSGKATKAGKAAKTSKAGASKAGKGSKTEKLSGRNPPINQNRQKLHTDGRSGKSQFKPDVDADELTKDAWHTGTPQFDKNGKFIGEIKEYGHQVGAQPNQNSVKTRFNRKNGIHGFPSSVGE